MLYCRLLVFVLALWAPSRSRATWVQQVTGYIYWQDIASSSDGTKLAAVVTLGNIWTSDDSGMSWVERSVSAGKLWSGITSSSDGTKLAAVAIHRVVEGTTYQGQIWFSLDSGATWSEGEPHLGGRVWWGIASSSDGTKVVAVEKGGGIWISTSSAISFNPTSAPSKDWLHVTSSSDGTKLAAVVYEGNIWTSDDSGTNWVERTVGGSAKKWRSITSSSDGTKLAAAVFEGNIWTSTDSGDTWFERSSGGAKSWSSITSSSDGSRLAAIVYHGYIWTSMDSGVTWVEDNLGPNMGQRAFCSGDGECHPAITSSSDGTKLAAVQYNSHVWTANACTTSSEDPSDDGTTGASFYCVNGGSVGGTTGSCLCRECDYGYVGESCETAGSACTAGTNWGKDGTDGSIFCINGGTVGGVTGWCTCTCNAGYEGSGCQTADSNEYWTERIPIPGGTYTYWEGIASSADGTKLVAVSDTCGAQDHACLYTSTDSGATWTKQTLPGQYYRWKSFDPADIDGSGGPRLASSADGTTLVGASTESKILISTDSGATWTERLPKQYGYWSSITSSADGTKLAVAGTQGSKIGRASCRERV